MTVKRSELLGKEENEEWMRKNEITIPQSMLKVMDETK